MNIPDTPARRLPNHRSDAYPVSSTLGRPRKSYAVAYQFAALGDVL